eukprot:COSAG06_NODE_51941_length_309_cov_0.452381_1_plen_25_part_01
MAARNMMHSTLVSGRSFELLFLLRF